jgi:oxygen-independent coproporphyrinogen-3 oxidase
VRPKNYRRLTGLALDEVFRNKIEALKAHGVVRETENALELTQLGAFFADETAQQFHSPDFVPYPREEYAEGPLNPYLNQNLFE